MSPVPMQDRELRTMCEIGSSLGEFSIRLRAIQIGLPIEGLRNTTRHFRTCPQAVLGALRSRHLVVESDVARLEPHPGVA